jgi:hypothetical protein
MTSNTKLFLLIKQLISTFIKKFFFTKIHFSNKLFLLFFGFLFGSLFGTLLPSFREKINWDGFITALIIFILEIISYLVYRSENKHFFLNSLLEVFGFNNLRKFFAKAIKISKSTFQIMQQPKFKNKTMIQSEQKTLLSLSKMNLKSPFKYSQTRQKLIFKNLNSFKIGIMLGFFIDAFKVGS